MTRLILSLGHEQPRWLLLVGLCLGATLFLAITGHYVLCLITGLARAL